MPFMDKSPTGCRPDNLIGAWFVEPSIFDALYQQVSNIDLVQLAAMNAEAEQKEAQENKAKPTARPAYALKDGIAVIEVKGPTTRYPSSYQRLIGGTSTMMAERALDKAAKDPYVKGIMMQYETPGGTVAGGAEFVDAIRRTNQKKPVWSHGTDLVASAGMLYAAQGQRFSVNRTAELGSMGTRAVLYDRSGAADKAGIRVIPIVAGKFKAAGLPGTEITQEQIEYFEERIREHNQRYVKEIAEARKIEPQAILNMEAKVFGPEKALELKLIDKVCSADEAFEDFKAEIRKTVSGTSGVKDSSTTNPASTRSRTMLNAEQLAQARQIPGASNVTEENADVVLLGAASQTVQELKTEKAKVQTLSDELGQVKSKIPKEPDLDILNEAADNAFTSIDNMLEAGHVLPEQAKILKSAIRPNKADGTSGLPNPLLLQKADDGKRVYVKIFDAFKLNKPTGVLNELSDANPVDAPGQGQAKTMEQAANAVVGAHSNRTYGHLVPKRAGANGNNGNGQKN